MQTQAARFKDEAFRRMDALRDADTAGYLLHCVFSQAYLNEALWTAMGALELPADGSLPAHFNLWHAAEPELSVFKSLLQSLEPAASLPELVPMEKSYAGQLETLEALLEHADADDLAANPAGSCSPSSPAPRTTSCWRTWAKAGTAARAGPTSCSACESGTKPRLS